jgi:hypothetical protein
MVAQERGLVSSLYRLVPKRISVLKICNRLVIERIGVIICDSWVPVELKNRSVPERIGVLIICNRWVSIELKNYKL